MILYTALHWPVPATDGGSMADMASTFYRYITIIQLVPKYPRSITTAQLHDELMSRGIYITQRTLYRDMKERLSVYFPLLCDTDRKPHLWSLDAGYDMGFSVLPCDKCQAANSISTDYPYGISGFRSRHLISVI